MFMLNASFRAIVTLFRNSQQQFTFHKCSVSNRIDILDVRLFKIHFSVFLIIGWTVILCDLSQYAALPIYLPVLVYYSEYNAFVIN